MAMYHLRRNKSELFVLTGAIYAFVAYLTAFALEILFLIDLTRRSNEILASLATTTTTGNPAAHNSNPINNDVAQANLLPPADPAEGASVSSPLSDRLTFESMQAHVTISSLTIAILYFIIFITSLVLIVALILRSTFMLLMWLCAMTTMYLPEFGLVIYVSAYSWGLNTRNGQTELIFYLFRAALNLIFILRAHKLQKQWNYEKNFFRLKSNSTSGAFSTNFSSPYDSPYFISGARAGSGSLTGPDSLTTTINPIFSSTLNLNRYDFVRDQFQQHSAGQNANQTSSSTTNDTSRTTSPITQNSFHTETASHETRREHLARLTAAPYSRDATPSNKNNNINKFAARSSFDFDGNQHQHYGSRNESGARRFYLGEPILEPNSRDKTRMVRTQAPHRQSSMLSINDDYAYEMDLDYRTLSRSPSRNTPQNVARDLAPATQRHHQQQHNQAAYNAASSAITRRAANTTGQRFEPNQEDFHQQTAHQAARLSRQSIANMSRSYDDLAYSTASLDRRNSRDFTLTEQVVLRPLGHQPFEYLHRPGSTTNLNFNRH